MPMHKSDLLYGILVYVMVASSEMRESPGFPNGLYKKNKWSLNP